MQRESVWTPIADMVHYQVNGNYQTFDRFFCRSLELLNLDLDTSLLRKMRRRVFRMMRISGLIEIDSSSPERRWSVSPNHCFTSGGHTYYLGSSRNFHLLQGVAEVRWETHQIPIFCEEASRLGVFTMELPRANQALQSSPIIEQILKSVLFTANADQAILSSLPSSLDVLNHTTVQADPTAFGISEGTEYFCFDRLNWFECSPKHRLADGFFRAKLDIGRDQYFIRSGLKDKAKSVYRVIAPEWGYFVAAGLLNLSFTLKYSPQKSELRIPFGLPLPTLLERVLFLCSLRASHYESGTFVYPSISKEVVKRLVSLYPVLELEVE